MAETKLVALGQLSMNGTRPAFCCFRLYSAFPLQGEVNCAQAQVFAVENPFCTGMAACRQKSGLMQGIILQICCPCVSTSPQKGIHHAWHKIDAMKSFPCSHAAHAHVHNRVLHSTMFRVHALIP